MRNRTGFTLLEMLAYIACLGLVLASVTFVFVTSSRLHATGTATMERMRVVGEIRRAFLRDVREAQHVAAGAGAYATDANHLVLELPPQTEGGRYVAYGLFDESNRLGRYEFVVKPDNTVEYLRLTAFPLALEGARVTYDAAEPRQVALEIDVDRVGSRPIPKGYKRKAPVTYSMRAALRTIVAEGGSR